MEEEDVKGLGDYLDIIRRHKYLVIIPALILIVISVAVAYLLPSTYKSEGLILIEAQEIPSDLIRSTVTSYADQRIEVIKQRIMTTAKVMDIVKKYNIYPALHKKSSPSKIVALFRENIEVNMVSANVTDPRSGRSKRASIAFNVSFMDTSPVLAQKVANELVTEFLNENVRTRTERATETKAFLEEEGDKFQRKVQLLEKKIAEFKDEYSDSLPELLEYNLSMSERLQDELATNQNQVMVLKDQILTMSLELTNLHVYMEAGRPTLTEKKASTSEEQLQQAKADYSRLQTKYSPNHPDVMQLQRQIEALERELGVDSSEKETITLALKQAQEQLQQLNQRYVDGHPDVKSLNSRVQSLTLQLEQVKSESENGGMAEELISQTKQRMNPIYLQINSKIDSSEREIVRLRARQKEVQDKLTTFEQRIVQTHQVQRAYDDLTRDHANNLAKYKELRAKQLEAELAQNLESENKGESFTLIEPPQVPNKAEKPNRPKILAMGVVASFSVGIGLALLMEMLTGGVRGYNEITRVVRHAPLVVVPVITTMQDMTSQRSSRRRLVFFIVILLSLLTFCFHLWVMDLEVLWFKILRKVSLL